MPEPREPREPREPPERAEVFPGRPPGASAEGGVGALTWPPLGGGGGALPESVLDLSLSLRSCDILFTELWEPWDRPDIFPGPGPDAGGGGGGGVAPVGVVGGVIFLTAPGIRGLPL